MSERSVNQQPVAIVKPTRWQKVPTVDARYWTLMTVASVLGCNLGDDCSFYAGWNHWIGLGPLALIFAAIVFGERRSKGHREVWYWAAVLVLRTAATNLADLATHTFDLPYTGVIAGLAVLQVIVVLLVAQRLSAADAIRSGLPAIDGWYWVALLTAGTLGTAIGDWVAEELHLTTGYGTLILSAIYALVLLLGRSARWSTKGTYWSAVLAVRAAGTTAGDWLAFREEPGLHNGLHLGLPLSTALSGALFAVCLLGWTAGNNIFRDYGDDNLLVRHS